jgi:hypothetical protein
VIRIRILFLTLLIIPLISLAQTTGKISGKITDENNEPIIGANIVVEETSLGASADVNGNYFIINIPVGSYELKISAIGYASQKVEKVSVNAGLTTKINATLKSSSVQLQEVVIQYTRPAVQKDLTSKMQGFEIEDIQALPVKGSVKDIITKQAGISADISTTPVTSQPVFGQFATIPSDGLHFRGGRTNETVYLLDGINVTDQLWGGFNLDVVGEYTLQSIRTLTGTFGPQYGEAMSGVILMNTLDNVVKDFNVQATTYSDKLGKKSGEQNSYNYEVQLSGPVYPLSNVSFFGNARVYSSDGYINGYIYPDYIDSKGTDKSGSVEVVPMAFRDSRLFFAKLIWQISDALKFRIGAMNSTVAQGVYNHYFKYNPYGTPHTHLYDDLFYGKLTHVLSPSTYYDITVSNYSRKFVSHVYDTQEEYEIVEPIGGAEFSISGGDYVRFDSKFSRLEIQGNFASQVTQQHFINAGFSISKMRTILKRVNPYGWQTLEDYDLKPEKYAAFVNDKMEFEDIGMVVNIGLRYDYVNPNRDFIEDITKPEGSIGKVKARQYFSPRLGISYPISDAAAFRFGYGHYYQYPDFYQSFQGMNSKYELYPAPNVKSVSGAIAKGDIQEEKTINYEVGVQAQLSNEISIDVTGFYRKISNLIGIEIIEGFLTSGDVVKAQKFPVFDNVNFATVKGVEVSLSKRLSNNFSGFLNYTYSQSLVSSSLVLSQPQDVSRTFPADWDQTHSLSFGAIFSFPQQWGFSLLGSAASGLPYTYNQYKPNAERAPWIGSFDGLAYKEFSFGSINTRFYVQVMNIFNRKNVWWVYADSGQPGVDTNPATSDDYTNNPQMWGPGRRVQIGLSISY